MSATSNAVGERAPNDNGELRRVIIASSLGTMLDWYDFLVYGSLAIFFSALFFPADNQTSGFLIVLVTYGVGYVIRPLGTLLFGRIGDALGRKYTFLITVTLMGACTAAIGLLPTFASAGWLAPIGLIVLRLMQGLAVSGEYGGGVIFSAEHAPNDQRGHVTGWVQGTATLAMAATLLIILAFRLAMDAESFAAWGWRLPFLVSVLLLAVSIYVRSQLSETPVFLKMQAEGRLAKSPLKSALASRRNIKKIAIALFGSVVGQAAIWNTSNFYILFFLTGTLKVDYKDVYILLGVAFLLGVPLNPFFAWVSDKVGRKPVILTGFLLAAVSFVPIFHVISNLANPALARFLAQTPITVSAPDCHFHLFSRPTSRCDEARNYLVQAGVNFTTVDTPPGTPVQVAVGDQKIPQYTAAGLSSLLAEKGYPSAANPAEVSWVGVTALVFVMQIYVAMVYGPLGAFLVEYFPPQIRYTSVSFTFHLGNGVFGGFLALVASAITVYTGNIFVGVFYPSVLAMVSLVVGFLFIPETKDRDINVRDE